MDTYKLAQALQSKYAPENVDMMLHDTRSEYLSGSIIPSNVLAYSGVGAELQTNNGRLIDLSSMTVNCILGQNDPWVNANLVAYLLSGRPSFLTTRIGGDLYYKVAQRLLRVTSRTDGVINHRQSNGTDVAELAILAAYQHRREGQTTLVSFEGSYHGQGLTAYHASHLQTKHRFFIHDSPVVFLDQPSNTFAIDEEMPLSEKDRMTLQKLTDIAPTVFAVILEPIQVNNSLNTPSRAFMRALRDICTNNHIALIYDEIQTGCGWLGTMTAAERYGVQPNLFMLSKALTSGNGPLSALISDKEYQDIPEGTAAKTNGADIRSLVAANAVMDRLFGLDEAYIPENIPDQLKAELRTGLLATFATKAERLKTLLDNTQATYPGIIKAVKGDGLIRGLQLTGEDYEANVKKTKQLQQELFDNGVFVRHSKDTLIIKPPLVITDAQLDQAFEIINKVIARQA